MKSLLLFSVFLLACGLLTDAVAVPSFGPFGDRATPGSCCSCPNGKCTYNYRAVLVWSQDQILGADPQTFDNATLVEEQAELTFDELLDLLDDALDWFNVQFGVDITGGSFDNETFMLTLTDGLVQLSIYNGGNISLVASSGAVNYETKQCPQLIVVTISYFPFNVSASFYGGVYGDYLTDFGLTTQYQTGQFLSYGQYIITVLDDDYLKASEYAKLNPSMKSQLLSKKKREIAKRTIFKSRVPNQIDIPGFISEEMILYDNHWYTGMAIVKRKLTHSLVNDTLYLAQYENTWLFPSFNDPLAFR